MGERSHGLTTCEPWANGKGALIGRSERILPNQSAGVSRRLQPSFEAQKEENDEDDGFSFFFVFLILS
jgi:hypothetical protein